MSNNLLYSFGKITEKRNFGFCTDLKEKNNVEEFSAYMDNLLSEINKTDKRKNFFKMLFL